MVSLYVNFSDVHPPAQLLKRHLSLTGFGAHFKMKNLHILKKELIGGHHYAGQGGDQWFWANWPKYIQGFHAGAGNRD
jgi:hypothetical protein